MSFIKQLLDTAVADTDVLHSLNQQGDNFSVPRNVDFLLRAPDEGKAELACNYLNDNSYGNATITEANGDYSVTVLIHMPVTQNVILSVSGFVATVCHLYGLDYDGWGCRAQLP